MLWLLLIKRERFKDFVAITGMLLVLLAWVKVLLAPPDFALYSYFLNRWCYCNLEVGLTMNFDCLNWHPDGSPLILNKKTNFMFEGVGRLTTFADPI